MREFIIKILDKIVKYYGKKACKYKGFHEYILLEEDNIHWKKGDAYWVCLRCGKKYYEKYIDE